jgi:phosphoribosylanthranilate isomerase
VRTVASSSESRFAADAPVTTSASAATAFDDRLASPDLGVRVKVCGITEPRELEALARRQVDFVGLWFGVPGGPADLALESWRPLAEAAAATGTLAPVLVTFLKDADAIGEALDAAHVHWVQLHGYPTPGVVRAVKALGPDVRVIKVLHVRGGACVEEKLLGAYEKAGADVFLFDAVAEDGRVGSTGQTLDAGLVASLAQGITKPFLLAGGISADNRDAYAQVARHPLFLGIDVDTNARGADGKVDEEKVAAIVGAWKAAA